MSLLEKKARVFWHETGHFVANLYNKKYYGKFGTESIFIKEGINGRTGEVDYEGEHNQIAPPEITINDIIEHPASKIASLTYGCIFQCIYTQQPFSSCFNTPDLCENGSNDFKKATTIAKRFELNDQELKKLFLLIEDQFKAIKEEPEFKELFSNNIEDFIVSDIYPLPIDLDKLERLVSTFIKQHEISYRKFVAELEPIFHNHRCLTSKEYALRIANTLR